MRIIRLALACTAVVLLTSSSTRADAVLLISSGDTANNAMIQSALQAQGDTVTVGPTYNNFTGGNLSGYKDVLLVPNGNSWNMGDMPTSGQQALVNYVANGGGLVTSELLMAKFDAQQDFQTLYPAIPVSWSNITTFNNSITFGKLTSDPVMNANLPSSFTFQTTSTASGGNGPITETFYLPKAGATSFFTTDQWQPTATPQIFGSFGTAYGVIGWNFGQGRVVSISSLLDNTALSNSNMDTLVANSLKWAQEGDNQQLGVGPNPPTSPTPPVTIPEPAAMFIWSVGLAGFALSAYRRRRGKA